MRYINGCHASTVGYAYENEEMFKIISPTGLFTMLDTLLTDIENDRWYAKLRQIFGKDVLIHIRMYSEAGWENPQYHPHWVDLNPTVWANECYRRLSLIPNLLNDPNVIISFNNEPDLAIEGHPGGAYDAPGHYNVAPETYAEIFNWYTATVTAFRLKPFKVSIATTPLATGHEPPSTPPDWECTMAECTSMVGVCDVLNVHAYFQPEGTDPDGYFRGYRALRPKGYRERVQGLPPVGGITDPGGLAMQFPSWPFIVSEFGNFAHDLAGSDEVSRTMQGYHSCYEKYSNSTRCLGITPFLWNSGDEHKANRIRGNVLLTAKLQDMTRYPAAVWPYVDTEPTPPLPPVTEPVFMYAFKDIADKYGTNIVGEPLEQQSAANYDGFGNVLLFTTKGVMIYNARVNTAFFLAGIN